MFIGRDGDSDKPPLVATGVVSAPIVAAPAAGASTALAAAPAVPETTSTPYVISITGTGTGTASTNPNIADATLGVETVESDADVAIRDNTD
jgi:uncharacterized protein YggE